MHGRKILIVDDDPVLVGLLEEAFSREGAEVCTALDGQQGLRQFFDHRPDLVLLDVRMPVMDGWQTCERIRDFSDVPIIMMSFLGAEADVVRGLDCGAVDYVTKSFSLKVLMARVRGLLRRAPPSPGAEQADAYDDGYLSFDLESARVAVRGEPVALTGTEYRLLAYLFQNAGRVVSREQILERVWGREYRDSAEYVHVYVWRLRQKLEEDPRQPKYLVSRRGLGYHFEPQATRSPGTAERGSGSLLSGDRPRVS